MIQRDEIKAMINIYRAAVYELIAISRDQGLSKKQYHELLVELNGVMEVLKLHQDRVQTSRKGD